MINKCEFKLNFTCILFTEDNIKEVYDFIGATVELTDHVIDIIKHDKGVNIDFPDKPRAVYMGQYLVKSEMGISIFNKDAFERQFRIVS